jgi:hypothetical protein
MEKEAIVARNEDTWPHYSKKKAILALPILMEACPVMVQLHINIFSKRKKRAHQHQCTDIYVVDDTSVFC